MGEKTEAHVKEARERLEAGVENLLATDGWRNYLRQMSKFHNYSWSNNFLIQAQCPGATFLKGFKGWLDLGRCVRKGEKAIWIWAPAGPYKVVVTNDEGEEEERRSGLRFKVTCVFDYSQTDPIPNHPHPFEPAPHPYVEQIIVGDLDTCALLSGALTTWAVERGITFEADPMPGIGPDVGGYFAPWKNSIWIRPGDAPRMFRTLVHEVAHALTHDALKHEPWSEYAVNEVLVESVAFIVLDYFGVDSSLESTQYVASWLTKDAAGFKKSLSWIQKTAHDMIETLLGASAPSEEVAA